MTLIDTVHRCPLCGRELEPELVRLGTNPNYYTATAHRCRNAECEARHTIRFPKYSDDDYLRWIQYGIDRRREFYERVRIK